MTLNQFNGFRLSKSNQATVEGGLLQLKNRQPLLFNSRFSAATSYRPNSALPPVDRVEIEMVECYCGME